MIVREGESNVRGQWVAVRTVVRLDEPADDGYSYEERITLWATGDLEVALTRGLEESEEYASLLGGASCGLAQAYLLPDSPTDGAEVFSLVRRSELTQDDYIARHFDTGREVERQFGQAADQPVTGNQ